MSNENDPTWPADDPWYRFTPRSLAVGYLSLFAALVCLAWSVWSLLAGGLGTARTVFFVAFGILAVLWIVRATSGLKVVMRRRAGR